MADTDSDAKVRSGTGVPRAVPVPTAASFNTERETKGVRPGKNLDEKAKTDTRRSSYTEDQTSFKKKDGETLTGSGELNTTPLEEPPAPKPGAPKSGALMKSMLNPAANRGHVILNSKTQFSNLQTRRAREADGSEGHDAAGRASPGPSGTATATGAS